MHLRTQRKQTHQTEAFTPRRAHSADCACAKRPACILSRERPDANQLATIGARPVNVATRRAPLRFAPAGDRRADHGVHIRVGTKGVSKHAPLARFDTLRALSPAPRRERRRGVVSQCCARIPSGSTAPTYRVRRSKSFPSDAKRLCVSAWSAKSRIM